MYVDLQSMDFKKIMLVNSAILLRVSYHNIVVVTTKASISW
jgi:hypothetical protein